MVPGPTGRPQLATVHGGERVLTGRDRRQTGGPCQRAARMNWPGVSAE